MKMSKEISLSELIHNAPPTSHTLVPPLAKEEPKPVAEEPVNMNPEKPVQPASRAFTAGKPTKTVSIDDIAKTLPGKPEEEIKNPEIVDNAFKAMHDTIAEKKRFFDEEVLPVIEENAKQMAMEKELENLGVDGTDPAEKKDAIDKITEAMDVDNIDEELAAMEEEELTEVSLPSMPKFEKVETPIEVPPAQSISLTDEETKETLKLGAQVNAVEKEESAYFHTSTSLEEDESTLDELLRELDDPTKEVGIEEELGEEESIEETRKRLQSNIGKVIHPSTIDFSQYTIRNKPLAVSAVLNNISNHKIVKTADWALYGSKRSITVTEASGPELDALVKSIRNSNAVNAAIMSLKLVYNHIVDANKPPFEVWARLIHTEDLDSLYFALYKATYADTNMIAYKCEKEDDDKYGCKKTSVLSVDVDKMVKFETPEVEAEFNELLRRDTTTASTVEEPSLMALSEHIAITYNKPNLYSTLIQYSTLNPKIVDKYDDLLDTLAYIDGFFYIDNATKELVPMPIKQYPNNLNKSVLEKIKIYGQVLKTLTSDEYDIALAKLSNLGESPKVTYVTPEVICPECGSPIAEEPIGNMLDMVFNRRQLAQIQGL